MRKLLLALTLILTSLSAPTSSSAQGRKPATQKPSTQKTSQETVVTKDGRRVILKPDGTWVYSGESKATSKPQTLNGEVSLITGVVFNSGDVKPVARTRFYLLDEDLETILTNAGLKPLPEYDSVNRTIVYKNLVSNFRTATMNLNAQSDFERERYSGFHKTAISAIAPHLVIHVTTDFSGKATFDPVPEGTYFIFGVHKLPRGEALVWNLRTKVKSGQHNVITLDQYNAQQ